MAPLIRGTGMRHLRLSEDRPIGGAAFPIGREVEERDGLESNGPLRHDGYPRRERRPASPPSPGHADTLQGAEDRPHVSWRRAVARPVLMGSPRNVAERPSEAIAGVSSAAGAVRPGKSIREHTSKSREIGA